MATRRFYASEENFRIEIITLDFEQTRHLRDVLRLRAFGKVRVFDGKGKEFFCRIETIENRETRLNIIEEITPAAPESCLNLALAIALLKGEKFDLVVQKAVELGATKIIPLNTKRGDVKLTNAGKKSERWRKIVIDATRQCGRAKLLELCEPLDFQEFVETSSGARVLFAEKGGESFSMIEKNLEITAVIGSEGGWEDAEIEAARRNDFQIVTLNGRILRAETAAISVAAILQHRFGDLK